MDGIDWASPLTPTDSGDHAGGTLPTWTLTIPHIPTTLNVWSRRPRLLQHKMKQMWDDLVQELVQAQGLPPDAPWPGAVVVYTLHFRHTRARDTENYLVVPKFINDGLIRAGLTRDDNWHVIYPLVFFAGEKSSHDYLTVTAYRVEHPHDTVAQWIAERIVNPHG